MDVVKAALEVCKVTDKFVVRDTLAKAVRRLMTDPEGEAVKSNVKKLQSLALQAVAEGGSVQKNFKNFVEEVQAYRRRPSLKFLDNNHATLGDEDELEAAPELQPLVCVWKRDEKQFSLFGFPHNFHSSCIVEIVAVYMFYILVVSRIRSTYLIIELLS